MPRLGILIQPAISYSSVFDNGSGPYFGSSLTGSLGNVEEDPMYATWASTSSYGSWDLSLDAASTLVDAGNPDVLFNDLDGTRNDMGHTGGPTALP